MTSIWCTHYKKNSICKKKTSVHVYDIHFKKFTQHDKMGLSRHQTHMATHIMCNCSKWYTLYHQAWKYISMSYTHMLHVSCMSVHGLCTLTFYHVSTLRHLSKSYTHMLHISSDVETTPVSMWNRRSVPASRGYEEQGQCNWVRDSHKSTFLRILHKKLRCQQINSQFGSGLIKCLYELH